MVLPTVTELPRNLEPASDDTFMQDLDERTAPRSELGRHQPHLQPGGAAQVEVVDAGAGRARAERRPSPS